MTLKEPMKEPDEIRWMAAELQEMRIRLQRTEQAFEESEKKYRMLMDNLNVGVFLSNLQGVILHANPQLARIIGYSSVDELLAAPVQQFYADIPDRERLVRDLLEKQAVKNREMLSRKKDGSVSWILLNAALQRDCDGEAVGFLGIVEDISDRRTAEQALQESEKKFRTLSEATFEAIFLTDQGVCVGQNRAAEEMFGYSKEEALGTIGTELIAPEWQGRVLYNMLSGYEEPYEATALRKDGTTFPCEIQGKMLDYQGRRIRVTALRDITDRREVEEALKQSEARYRDLFENANDAIFTQDLLGNFTSANKAAELLMGAMGAEREGLLALNVRDVVVQDDLSLALEHLRLKNEDEEDEAGPYELRIRSLDGIRKWIEVKSRTMRKHGRPFAIHGIARDITERKQADKALKESEAKYRSLVEFSPDGIFVQVGDWIEFANTAMANLFGAESPEALVGVRALDFVHPDYQKAIADRIARNLQEREPVPLLEQKLVRFDGTCFDAEAVGAPVVYKGQDARQVLVRDITERKRTEGAIKSIVAGVSGEIGGRFFESSVMQFARILDADFTLIGEICHPDEELVVNSLAFTAGGCLQSNFTYQLKDAPCEEVSQRGICSYPRGVAELFPRDEVLREMNIEAYVGVGLYDSHGTPMGIMAAMYRKPLENVEFAESVLQIFASRAAAEIERKRSEAALSESEATLRTLLQAAPIGIGQASSDRTLGWTNQVLCKMLGYSTEELTGKNARMLYESEEEFLRVGREKHSEILEHGTGSMETRLRRKDGTVFDALVSSSSVLPRDLSRGLVFTVVDITERKRTEAQIRLNEERLQSLYDISQYKANSIQDLLEFTLHEAVKLTESKVGCLHLYDEENNRFDLNTWSNEMMEVCGTTVTYGPDNLDDIGIWGEAVRQRRPVVVNDLQTLKALKIDCPRGQAELHNFMTIPVFGGEKIVAVVGVANKDSDYNETDVRRLALLMDSAWRIAEAKRSELVQRRSAIALEYAAEGVVITDTEGTVQYVNPAFERMTGYAKDELLGNNPRILRSGEQDSTFYEQMWNTIRGGEIWTGRIVNRKKDGTFYTEDATISPVWDDSGAITNFVGMKRDITGQLELSKQLLHAQKMQAVGTLAGGIAHDFNNLLQAILGYSELLMLGKETEDPDCKKIEVIQQAARDGADLVSRILTFSRKLESRTRPIDLNEEIRKAQRLLRRTVPRMIEIKLALEEALAIIDADPAQMEQVLLNLAVNAQHAMPNGGRLLIETSNVSLNDEYVRTHLGVDPGQYALLTVSDTGAGMEADVLDRIFEPFFTTKTNGEGTGLGLSIVHGIVSQHGGYIRCSSEPGRGTSFKIYFPVSASKLLSDKVLTREMPAFGNETILLVDDDRRVRTMASQMLEVGGYKVITARSGEEALETYAGRKDEIDLIILDLIMPGMGGKRCLEKLLSIDAKVRVIVASGYPSNGLTRNERGRGARGFVSKPYDSRDILSAIRKVLDKGHL